MAKAKGAFVVKWNKSELAKIRKAGPNALVNILDRAKRHAIKGSPHDTGTNRRSIDTDISADKMKGQLFTTSGYGGLLEIGTGIHGPTGKPITPKAKKVLSWVGKDGKRIFAMRVKGMKKQPYLIPAVQKTRGELPQILRGMIEK